MSKRMRAGDFNPESLSNVFNDEMMKTNKQNSSVSDIYIRMELW